MAREVFYGPTTSGRARVAQTLLDDPQALAAVLAAGAVETELKAIVDRGNDARTADEKRRTARALIEGKETPTYEAIVTRDADLRARVRAAEGDIAHHLEAHAAKKDPGYFGLALPALDDAGADRARAALRFLENADFKSYRFRTEQAPSGGAAQQEGAGAGTTDGAATPPAAAGAATSPEAAAHRVRVARTGILSFLTTVEERARSLLRGTSLELYLSRRQVTRDLLESLAADARAEHDRVVQASDPLHAYNDAVDDEHAAVNAQSSIWRKNRHLLDKAAHQNQHVATALKALHQG
jgi:hypothetical protein